MTNVRNISMCTSDGTNSAARGLGGWKYGGAFTPSCADPSSVSSTLDGIIAYAGFAVPVSHLRLQMNTKRRRK
jgi:hypothetical protein